MAITLLDNHLTDPVCSASLWPPDNSLPAISYFPTSGSLSLPCCCSLSWQKIAHELSWLTPTLCCWFSEQELGNLVFIVTASSPSYIWWVISGRDFIPTLSLGFSQGKAEWSLWLKELCTPSGNNLPHAARAWVHQPKGFPSNSPSQSGSRKTQLSFPSLSVGWQPGWDLITGMPLELKISPKLLSATQKSPLCRKKRGVQQAELPAFCPSYLKLVAIGR